MYLQLRYITFILDLMIRHTNNLNKIIYDSKGKDVPVRYMKAIREMEV